MWRSFVLVTYRNWHDVPENSKQSEESCADALDEKFDETHHFGWFEEATIRKVKRSKKSGLRLFSSLLQINKGFLSIRLHKTRSLIMIKQYCKKLVFNGKLDTLNSSICTR